MAKNRVILSTPIIQNLLNKRLTGRTAFITGASRGIGQQIALGLAQKGCDLVLHARTESHLEKTKELLTAYTITVTSVTGDLALEADRKKIIAQTKARATIDILYNNAAIMDTYKPIWDKTTAEWQALFNVNVFAVVHLCTEFIPDMKKRNWGRVINISSGIKDTPHLAPYSASKATIDKYTQDLAAELQGTNILVNYIDPGWLKTDLGGQQAPNEVTSVIPGALIPALLDDMSYSGQLFRAQDYAKIPV